MRLMPTAPTGCSSTSGSIPRGTGARRRGRGDRRDRHGRLQGPLRLRGRGSRGAGRAVRPRARRVSRRLPGGPARSARDRATARRPPRARVLRLADPQRRGIGATPLAAHVVNVKPSRNGSLRALFEVYARCAREGRPMYGGGMGELGVGRGQIELLAAFFHPDAPNDVAPSAYNEDDPPGGLPASPLAPRPGRPASAGRRRHASRLLWTLQPVASAVASPRHRPMATPARRSRSDRLLHRAPAQAGRLGPVPPRVGSRGRQAAGFQRAYHARNIRDEDEVISFGLST